MLPAVIVSTAAEELYLGNRRDCEGEKDLVQRSEGAGDKALVERNSAVPKCRNFEAADISQFFTVPQALSSLWSAGMEVNGCSFPSS